MRRTGKRSKSSSNDKRDGTVDIGAIMRDGTQIDRAVRQATRQAVLMHKKLGLPVVTWENGRAVWVKPQDI